MFKLIKWLLLMMIAASIVLWFTDIKVRGRTLKERYEQFKQTELYREGVKDLRSIVGESLKALGQEISGEVTDEEREQLERVIKQEMTSDTTTGQGNSSTTKGATQWQQQPLKALPPKQPTTAAPTAPAPAQ